jgi:poly(hydroxyalkanoate) depolymerase family esterase
MDRLFIDHASTFRAVARRALMALSAAAAALYSAPAQGASLAGPISGWASGNAPSYVSMYEYVPAKLANNPPILVVSHYCGGSAAGVFGEAQGGGLVAAADQYGFLMVFPQTSNNCWNVASTAALTHDGGGDTQAVVDMVDYEISKRGANANRVYATGTSSGAMMTEALLAVYPDVFKAGAEFSGVPAGCWSVNDPNGQWSSPCASGQVTHTAQEWGDMVRAMYPGYSGYRPRVQLWHGTADATINYNNQLEAIKEWTNVLGLSATPTSNTTVTFGNHSWTRQIWQDACGVAVLDAWAEQNGPHGTDANLNATYVIPFLGLDKSGPVDPDVAACDGGSSSSSSSSTGSSSGASSSRASSSSGGSSAAGSGSSSAGSTSSGGGTSSKGVGTSSSPPGASSGTGSATHEGSSGESGSGASSGGGASTGGEGSGSSGATPGCSCDVARSRGPGRGLAMVAAVSLATAWFRRRRARTRRPG